MTDFGSLKISVIIPVYNAESFLSRCLENVVYQSYKNLEIIVVDDGSSDNSAAIYNDYAQRDARIRVIKQDNQGQSAARNAGVAAATGDYIHYLDSDDYIDLDYYEKMVAAAQETGADVAAGGFEFQRRPALSVAYANRLIVTSPLDKALLTQGVDCTYCWRFLYRREWLERLQLTFEHGKTFEDILYTITALYHANKVVLVPGVQYHYFYNDKSTVTASSSDPEQKKARKARHDEAHAAGKKFFAERGIEIKNLSEEQLTSYRLFGVIPLINSRKQMRNLERVQTDYYFLGFIPFFRRVQKLKSSMKKFC